MTLTLSLSTDKPSYSPGEAVIVTANYADPQTTTVVTVTATARDSAGEVATATTSYAVAPSTAPPVADVAATDNRGGSYALRSNSGGVATFAGTAPAPLSVVSGFGGAEPLPAQAGNNALSWEGFTWELEDWGTAPGQPKAAGITVTPSAMVLSAGEIGTMYAGAEADSARGDQGITSNPSTWGYGTYRWVIGKDLTTLPAGLCLGLFTYWAQSKGGPPGQKEIDIEFYSAGTIPGAPAFVQFGYYQDTTAQVSQGVPPGHVLLPGSQFALPSLPGVTAEFTWLPSSIAWKLSDPAGSVLASVTATQGQQYSWTQLYGGNRFAGTVAIPATGKQQVIANLWCPNGSAPPGNPGVQVPVTSFSYTPA